MIESRLIDLDGDTMARVSEGSDGEAFVQILAGANPEMGLGPQEIRLGGPLLRVGLAELLAEVDRLMAEKDSVSPVDDWSD